MKIIAIIIVLTSLTSSIRLFENTFSFNNCSKFKVGVFSYHVKSEDRILYYTLRRSDTIQIEKNEQTGNISKFRVNWIDSCTYELRFLEGTEVLTRELLDLKKRLILRTTILGSGSNYYLFKSTSNILTYSLQDTIWTTR